MIEYIIHKMYDIGNILTRPQVLVAIYMWMLSYYFDVLIIRHRLLIWPYGLQERAVLAAQKGLLNQLLQSRECDKLQSSSSLDLRFAKCFIFG